MVQNQEIRTIIGSMGEKIAALRKKRQLTQAQLAELCKVPWQHVSKWERGACFPGGKAIARLVLVLGRSLLTVFIPEVESKSVSCLSCDRKRPALKANKGYLDCQGNPITPGIKKDCHYKKEKGES